MRELTRVQDLSHEASIRVALGAAGIEAVFDRPFAARAPAQSRSFVHDRDYDRAAALVATLQRTPVIESTDRRFQLARLWAVMILVVGFAAALWVYFIRG